MAKRTVCIITGPCGAGKSTIVSKLAKETERSAYIEVDFLRELIKNGSVSPMSYKGESRRQVDLSVRNACSLALNLLNEGFNVFIEDVIERKQQVIDYTQKLKKYNLQIFLLLPNKKILSKRDMGRVKEKRMGARALELHDIFTTKLGMANWHILDTSNHTVEETKDEILRIIKK